MPLRKNIILWIIDDAIMDMWVKFQYLMSFPDGHWLYNPRYFVNYPVCGVSRANILTGRRRRNLEGLFWHGQCDDLSPGTMARWNLDLSPVHHYPYWLQKVGYHTACLGKWLNQYPYTQGDTYIPPGWDHWKTYLEDGVLGPPHEGHDGPRHINYSMNVNGAVQGFGSSDTWTTVGADASGREAAHGDVDYSTDHLNFLMLKYLTNSGVNPSGCREPFYMYTGWHGVKGDWSANKAEAIRHRPANFPMPWSTADRPPSFNEADISDKSAWLRINFPNPASSAQVAEWDEQQVRKWRMCQSIDEALRDLITTLKSLTTPGVSGTWFDRTCIVIATENSNLLGHHRLDEKGLPYDPAITSPFFMRHPSIPEANMTSRAMFSTIDLAPTFCEIAQTRPSRPFDGMSILPLADGRMVDSQFRQRFISEWVQNTSVVGGKVPSWKCITTPTHKLIRYQPSTVGGTFPAEDELYEQFAPNGDPIDPDEMVNKVNESSFSTLRANLSAELAAIDLASAQ